MTQSNFQRFNARKTHSMTGMKVDNFTSDAFNLTVVSLADMANPGFIRANLVSATWPIGHYAQMLAEAISPFEAGAPDAKAAKGKPVANTVADHVSLQTGTFPKFVIAWIVYNYFMGDWQKYALVLSWDWISGIIFRDVAITLLVAGLWDFTLYSEYSPFFNVMKYVRGEVPTLRPMNIRMNILCTAGATSTIPSTPNGLRRTEPHQVSRVL